MSPFLVVLFSIGCVQGTAEFEPLFPPDPTVPPTIYNQWQVTTACAAIRSLAYDGTRTVVVQDPSLRAVVSEALITGVTSTGTLETTVTLFDGRVDRDDLCVRVEGTPLQAGLPVLGQADVTIQYRFNPDRAFGFDDPAYANGERMGQVSLRVPPASYTLDDQRFGIPELSWLALYDTPDLRESPGG